MSWMMHLGEPLAPTPEEAAHYIQAELEAAVPAGWVAGPVVGGTLEWTISEKSRRLGRPESGYLVRLSPGLESVLFMHGNSSSGPLGLHHFLLRSLIIDAAALRHYGMAACLENLMTHYEPNDWAIT
jgi:hypothetical protein